MTQAITPQNYSRHSESTNLRHTAALNSVESHIQTHSQIYVICWTAKFGEDILTELLQADGFQYRTTVLTLKFNVDLSKVNSDVGRRR